MSLLLLEALVGSFWWRMALVVFIAQGFLGICLFEWAWMRTKRVRLAEEELMQEFPSFRRLDVHNWSRNKFYPGCFLMLVPRTTFIFCCVFFVGGVQRLLFLGQDMSVPLEGWRRSLHKRVLWCVVPLVILLGFGYKLKLTDHDETKVDYSKYLGPNWREQKFKGKRVSTIVSNHVGFVEIIAYIALMTPPSFTPAHTVKKFPIGDHFVRSLNSIYVDRTQEKQKRDTLVKQLGDRQRLIEQDNRDWGSMCFFAEGSVTNGQNISRFRRGGFASGVAVEPIVFKYRYRTVSPDYTIVKGLELGFLMISEFALNIFDAHRYPIFVPNDYLYNEYAKTIPDHAKMEKWEIYAHAVADLMRNEGGFGVNEQANREKVKLQEFVWGEKDEISINGKTFYWPPRKRDDADKRQSNCTSLAKKNT